MKKIIGLGIGLLLFVSNVSALDFGIGAKAGINGAGLNLSVGLTKRVNLRVAVSQVNIDDEEETVTVGDDGAEGDIDAELEFDFGSNAIMLDWHIFNGGFRLTGGMFKQTGAVDLSGNLQSNIVIDGQPLATDDLGEISGEVELSDNYQPYIGIGWGRGAGGKGGFSFSADLGVAMLDPNVTLEADVNAGGTNGLSQAELNRRLADLESDAEDELDDLEFWPVLALGVNYAF
jgi:carbon monoxide dehydrogenase subunit G